MFCPTCGTQMTVGLVACAHCGRRLDDASDSTVEYRFSGPRGETLQAPWHAAIAAGAPTRGESAAPLPAAGDARLQMALGAGVLLLPIMLPLVVRLVFFPPSRAASFDFGSGSGDIWASLRAYALTELLTPNPFPAAAAYWLALARFPTTHARRAWAQTLALVTCLYVVASLAYTLLSLLLIPDRAPRPSLVSIVQPLALAVVATLPSVALWGGVGLAAAQRFAPWHTSRPAGRASPWRAWRRTLVAFGAAAALLVLPNLALIALQNFAPRHPIIASQLSAPLGALTQSLSLLGPLLLVLLAHLAGRAALAVGGPAFEKPVAAPWGRPTRAILVTLAIVALVPIQYAVLIRLLPAASLPARLPSDPASAPLNLAASALLPNAAAAAAGFALALARLPYVSRRLMWGQTLGIIALVMFVQALGGYYAFAGLLYGSLSPAGIGWVAARALPSIVNALIWSAAGIALAHAFARWPRHSFAAADTPSLDRYALALAGALLLLAVAGAFFSPFPQLYFGVGGRPPFIGPDDIARFNRGVYGALTLGVALLITLGARAVRRTLRPAPHPITRPAPAPAAPPTPQPRSATPN